MSPDLVRCLPEYQTEIWCWTLSRLALKAQSPWVERLGWAIHELQWGLPGPIEPTHWRELVDWDAAYHFGITGPPPPRVQGWVSQASQNDERWAMDVPYSCGQDGWEHLEWREAAGVGQERKLAQPAIESA